MNTFKNMMASVMIGSIAVLPMTISTTTYAKANTEQQATQQLVGLLNGINSFTANIEQKTYSNQKSTAKQKSLTAQHMNQTFTGIMKVERPGKFFWQTNSPAKQTIVTTGSTVWIYDPDLKQAVRQQLDEQVANTPALLLSGDSKKIMQTYRVTQPDAGKMFYTLYPKNKEGIFQSISLSFDAKKAPVYMVLQDNTGQVTQIKFSQSQLNVKIPVATFNFTPPKGTDIIDQ